MACKQVERALLHQPLGRDVHKIERTGCELALDGVLGLPVERRIEEGGLHAQILQRVDLILHQRDERRDDDAGAGPDQGGDLVAKRFAAARRHQSEAVAALQQRRDDPFLMQAETLVAEHLVELGARHGERFGVQQIEGRQGFGGGGCRHCGSAPE